jgi:hypothetical protein
VGPNQAHMVGVLNLVFGFIPKRRFTASRVLQHVVLCCKAAF